ncbi:ABC transporter permease [Mesorhizobium sp. M7A.T.Ca.TU.009.01.3.2]|uniref:putative B6 ABC transporter permease subunit 1 n=2 Tax=Mesorhizobium TaxID=68287 RepID=UPI000FCC39D0|nr:MULTISPECIES: ABC transporter permease [unclassified Mesorhizobium]RUU10955.1 ABC transporter permease [Mesorhizobium sp. M7A.T.Ca.TU.009.01.3.2]RUU83565.1 ABC transporter permease [Mesorhizobium sp. M7A.T.Ca.TU.009.01.1.2]RUU95480.1 ABC transporter permease [Mesorhizobium sp. M7A.T.Ca.TU.009.01.3.1]RUV52370.1 ABC transporter permease [Mesorhizobium sp. M7A.F.Ca.MR.228.00.0.0]MCQ8874355.1 ABC transporter permease [Mesorhizobium sp. LMG17149]
MTGLFSEVFLSALLFGAVTAAIPLLLAGLGEQISEKAGVLNIGIEGMMLAGAYLGFVGAFYSGSLWLGFLTGAVGGAAVALVMALLCVRIGLNQIVIGIALTLGLEGLTALLHHFQFSRSYPRLPAAEATVIPLLSDIPVIGPAFFKHHLIVYLAVALVFGMSYLYRRTQLGLNLQAAGDKPAALDVAGIDVVRTRTIAVLTTGALAGLGGAYLANVGAGLFIPFITNGAGFLGIVLAMLARGRPIWVLFGALLFGVCLSLTTAMQVAGINIPTDIIQMLPFLAVMIMLVLFGRRASLPAALGIPYERGAR